jgi:hypothetical protein
MIPDWAYTGQEENGLFVQDFKLRTKRKIIKTSPESLTKREAQWKAIYPTQRVHSIQYTLHPRNASRRV